MTEKGAKDFAETLIDSVDKQSEKQSEEAQKPSEEAQAREKAQKQEPDKAQDKEREQEPVNRGESIDRAKVIAGDGKAASAWALRFIVVVIASVFLFKIIGYVWVGVLPLLLALIFCTVLWPPVRWLRNHKVPSALAVFLVLITFFGAIGGLFAAMAPMIKTQSVDLYRQSEEGVRRILGWIETSSPFDVNTAQIQEAVERIGEFVRGQASNIASGVVTGVGAVTSIGTTLLLMLVLTFFFLKDGDSFLPWLRKYAGQRAGWHLSEVLMRSWNTLAGFIRTQAIVSLVDAVFIGVGLVILGVPLAPVLAVFTFFGGFIPIIGAFTAGALAVVVALVSNGLTNALLVLGLVILVQQLEGNVLSPILQSRSMNMHAAIVLLSVAVGGTLFGIVGAFLAVPIAAVFAVWFRYWAEMVSLRTGEITADDIQLATQQSQGMDGREAYQAVCDRMLSIGRKKDEAEQDA
ncbi:AI-2E family transporter [Corynebacterium sp. MSK044]|uniref:AI-2E family transporter n=1 Tax=Corynebacterium sp. MSK044 TaxID=3050195 RepID=UPI00254FA32E|nr:AI-2E family transporter [Corynebacterium sp. MSK044]MDK8797881.1 AI-2E family transporter [Corynebacterium sp. MSK044]